MTTSTTLFQIDDSAFVLPDRTYAALRAAIRTAPPDRVPVLEAIQYAWLGARAGGVGSVLDDRAAFGGLFTEKIAFLTPDGDLLTLPVCNAAAVAARYAQIHDLITVKRGGMWVVEMVEWGAPA